MCIRLRLKLDPHSPDPLLPQGAGGAEKLLKVPLHEGEGFRVRVFWTMNAYPDAYDGLPRLKPVMI